MKPLYLAKVGHQTLSAVLRSGACLPQAGDLAHLIGDFQVKQSCLAKGVAPMSMEIKLESSVSCSGAIYRTCKGIFG